MQAYKGKHSAKLLAAIGTAAIRLDDHHGSSSGMAWGVYGKGPYGGKGGGQWGAQYGWDYPPQYGLVKGGGKGKGKGTTKGQGPDQAAAANANNPKNDKKDRKIKQSEAKLTNMESKAAGTVKKGELLLDKGEDKDPPICPTCGTEHHNHSKIKCRNRICRSLLRPSTPAALPTMKAPRHPLLSSTLQAFLQQTGAVECLESKLCPKDAEDTQVPEEEDKDMDDKTPPQEALQQAEKVLENLKAWKADASVIKQQERVIANLPSPESSSRLNRSSMLGGSTKPSPKQPSIISAFASAQTMRL